MDWRLNCPLEARRKGAAVYLSSGVAIGTTMKNNQTSHSASRYKGLPIKSVLVGAAWGGVLGLLLATFLATPCYAGPRTASDGNDRPAHLAKFSSALSRHTGSNGLVTVIVQFRQMPGSSSLTNFQRRGAALQSRLHTIRAVTMRVPAGMLPVLAKDPNVLYITPDRNVTLTAVNEGYATAVEADVAAAQYAFDGTGVGVAVIDSGVADHPDLHDATNATRVVYSQSFVAGDTTAADKFGHGTHVAGLIGGTGANSGSANGYSANYAGMAPGGKLINLRVLDQNGSGTDSQVIAAIQQAIALKDTYNIRVINMSLGRPVFESYTLDPVDQAVEAAWKAGIVVVAAAGKNGRYVPTQGFGTIGVPGNDPAVITVGATMTAMTPTRVDDRIASYSSKGPVAIDPLLK